MSPNEAFPDLVNKIHEQFSQVFLPANKAGCATGVLMEKLDEIERSWRETRYPILQGQAAALTKQIRAHHGTDQERLLYGIKLLGQLLLQSPETIAAAQTRFLIEPSLAQSPTIADAVSE